MSVLSSTLCFDTGGWVAGGYLAHTITLINPQWFCSITGMGGTTKGELATQVYLEKRQLNISGK